MLQGFPTELLDNNGTKSRSKYLASTTRLRGSRSYDTPLYYASFRPRPRMSVFY